MSYYNVIIYFAQLYNLIAEERVKRVWVSWRVGGGGSPGSPALTISSVRVFVKLSGLVSAQWLALIDDQSVDLGTGLSDENTSSSGWQTRNRETDDSYLHN